MHGIRPVDLPGESANIDACLRAQPTKLFHLGLRGEVTRLATTRSVASARRFCFHLSNDPALIIAGDTGYATEHDQTFGSTSRRTGATGSTTTCSVIRPEQDQAVTPLSRSNTDESRRPSRRGLDRCRKIFEFLNPRRIYAE
jgi:hypothetical protein